jgi:maltose O-acetyltransferase
MPSSDLHPDPGADPRSMRERMLAGDLYDATGDPEIRADTRRAQHLQDRYNRTEADETELRRALLVELLGEVGPDVELRPPFYCDLGYRIRIGARCFANFGLVALDVAPITLGDDVQLGPNVQLLTPTHPLDPDLRRRKWEAAEPISVGDNVWIGGGAIVLPGVTIGANTVVGAGAVVTKDLPAGVLAVGNPARVVRTL